MESPETTRAKLLAIAGEVFAEAGFQGATIREISKRAGANVAAINYHFRDKMGLYEEVLLSGLSRVELLATQSLAGTPEEQLRAFVQGYLTGLLGEGKPSWFPKLVAQEMAQPTGALKRVVNEVVRPVEARLRHLVAQVTGLPDESEKARMCAHSLIGQCLHYHHARNVFAELWPELEYTPDRIGRIAKHIAEFSLGGLREAAKERQ